jgi:hypothetical protein
MNKEQIKATIAANDAERAALEAELAALKAENNSLKKSVKELTLKVSIKGALSVYGMGRFPVTLYKEQWLKLIAEMPRIEAFIKANDQALKGRE